MYFDRNWVEIVDYPPINPMARVRAWDFSASEPTTSGQASNPDYSAGVKMSRDKQGMYYIEDVVRFRYRTDKVLKEVVKVAISDGTDDTTVFIPTDPAAAGKTAAQFYLRTLSEAGVYAKTRSTTGHSGKLTRFKPFCALAESGSVKVVRGDWNEAFFNELESFTGEKSTQRYLKDDQCDAVADAFVSLARQVSLPTFSLPALEQASPIPRIN